MYEMINKATREERDVRQTLDLRGFNSQQTIHAEFIPTGRS